MNWKRESDKSLAEAFRETTEFFVVKTKRLPSKWATDCRKIPAGASPLSTGGQIDYAHELFGHCIDPMDDADNPEIRRIVLWWPIRDGKTNAVCCNVIGRTVEDDPGNIYSVHPTDDNADLFSTGDLEPMIGACLEKFFVAKKSRDSGRTIEFKKFAGGYIRIFSAGSLSKFRGTSIRVLLLHELDALKPEAIFKAFGRTEGFGDAIIIEESTGTDAAEFDADGNKVYHSNIEEAYEQGDKRKWFVKCKKCEHRQTIKYEQFKYPAGKMHLTKYDCEECDYGHNEKEWRVMVKSERFGGTGKWYPTAGLSSKQERDIEKNYKLSKPVDPSIRSYWRNGFNSLLPTGRGFKTKLHQFVANGVAAQRTPESRRVWINEIKAELWKEIENEEPAPAWKPIYEGREKYDAIPAPGLVVTSFVDVHANRLELFWRAFGRGNNSWGLLHDVIEGSHRQIETWEELGSRMKRTFKHEYGPEVKTTMTLIDCGWASEWVASLFFSNVYKRKENRWMAGRVRASAGRGAANLRIVAKRWATIGNGLKGVHIGTWEAKDTIYDLLRQDDEEEGRMHYNEKFEEEWFEQLTAETMVPVYKKGIMLRTYENPKGVRNEALDLEVGALAAFKLYNRDLDSIEAKLKADGEVMKKENEGKLKQKPKQINAPRPNSLVSSIRRGW